MFLMALPTVAIEAAVVALLRPCIVFVVLVPQQFSEGVEIGATTPAHEEVVSALV